ncbi:MAG: carboxypeptidase regulatory-like domain-containing protein, partial [Chloroflexi bacterium]|nr:carboxypeptidase regulatory-like domain-containing protein [Chloroflexota bacterium]
DYKASGQVNLVEANGRLQPFPNVLVQAYVEGTNTVVASALSRSDGTYTLNGLPTGTGSGGPLTELMVTSAGYPPGSTCPVWTLRGEHGPRIVLTASRPGYSQVHSNPAIIGHGDETATANEELSVAPPGTIAGQVTDAGTGKGIPGATVTVVNKPFSDIQFTTTTDANGNYTISNVPTTPPSGPAGSTASSYIITFSAPGYQTFVVGDDPNANNKTVITVTSQGTTIVNVALVPAKGGISGKVLDPSGAPVSGAVVTATPKNLKTGLVSTTTGADGAFSFTNISPDTYTLVATKAPFSPSASQTVVLAPGGNVTGVVLTLQTTRPGSDSISGTIRFTVQGSSSVPAPGIPVQLEDVTGVAIGGPVTTDANGQYSFTGLQDGTYKVQPVVANQTVTPRTVTLSAATGTAATGIDFTLSPIYTFPAGLRMISLPFNFSGTNVDVAQLLGLPIVNGQAAIASYDPSTNQYSLYPNLNANVPGAVGTQTLPGRGYWVKESKATAFLTGGSAITSATFDVTLLPGWNMIGDPYTGAVAWNLVQVEVPFQVGSFAANSPLSMQLAQSKHIINSPLYTWNGTTYTTTTTLRPFVGYWVYVDPNASQNLPVTITFTNPSP